MAAIIVMLGKYSIPKTLTYNKFAIPREERIKTPNVITVSKTEAEAAGNKKIMDRRANLDSRLDGNENSFKTEYFPPEQ